MLNRNKKIICTLSFLLITSLLYSGKVKKGFEALSVYNYFKAKQLFEKALKKEVMPASYGLSIIYFRVDNPFHNLDSASKYIRLAKLKFTEVDSKKRKKLLLFNIDSLKIEGYKDQIDSTLFQRCEQQSTFAAYQDYVDKYPDSKQLEKAVQNRNKVLFETIKTKNTSEAYLNFFTNYPKAAQVEEAQRKYEELLYLEQTKKGTIDSYQKFVKNNPRSPYLREAQDSIFEITTRKKSTKNYDTFIKNNPNNPNINRAWRELYEVYTEDYSPERIVEFRIDYPDYPFKDEVEVDMKLASKTFLPFKRDGKWGFIDTSGKVMISPIYDFVEPFQEGLAVILKNDRLGYINKSGKIVIPLIYNDGESFTNGVAIVAKGDNYGMINRGNKVIVPFAYEVLTKFTDGLALVANNNGYGFINEKGNEEIPVNLSYATDFKNGAALVEVDNKKGLINKLGQFIVPAAYNWLEPFGFNGLSRAKNDTAYGVLNKKGEEVVPFVYDKIGEFSSGLAIVKKGEQYGYVAENGVLKIPLKYTYSEGVFLWGDFKDGYAKYSRKGKFGIVDTTGEELVPSIFENILNYQPVQYTQVKKRGRWGYMNNSLQLKIPYNYDESLPFLNDYAAVRKDTAWGIINKEGKWEVLPSYAKVELIHDSLYVTKKNGKYGLMSNNLEEILSNEYDKIDNELIVLGEVRLIRVYQNDAMYYFDIKNRSSIRPKIE